MAMNMNDDVRADARLLAHDIQECEQMSTQCIEEIERLTRELDAAWAECAEAAQMIGALRNELAAALSGYDHALAGGALALKTVQAQERQIRKLEQQLQQLQHAGEDS